MADIELVSTGSVKAASHKECSTHERIELTPWDLQLLLVGPIQKGLLFHKPKTTQETREYSSENSTIQHLRTSLSRTLDFFNPLAGRLVSIQNDDNSISYFIDCNSAGAQFVHATANDVTIADILKPVYFPDGLVHSFFPLNGVRNCEGTSKPLLGVQVTELVDGIFIGCTLNHAVADGTSFWHFFNSWSEISRGFKYQISKPPALKRWFLDGTDCPIRIPPQKLPADRLTPLSLKERIFHFTKEKIAELKAKANAEIGMTNRVSSLQAVLIHFWRCVIRSQNLDPNLEVSYHMLIGARTRLHPPLPDNYFGNAVYLGTVTVKARDLLEGGLGHAAWEMNKMVALQTKEKARSFLESWVESPGLITVGNFAGNALIVSSSPRFNVYGNDFGWGRPLAVRSGSANKTHGKVTVFSAAEEGGIDIEASLSPETLEAMGNDSEFMDAVTSTN